MQSTRRFRLRLPVLLLLIAASNGCGDAEFPLAPVEGLVTFSGEPLADAHVGFEPIATRKDNRAGPGSYATTDKEGRFQLESLDGDTGAVVGSHRVTIRTFRAKKGPNGEMIVVQKEILPARYHRRSELTMEVLSGGTEQANFTLEPRNK